MSDARAPLARWELASLAGSAWAIARAEMADHEFWAAEAAKRGRWATYRHHVARYRQQLRLACEAEDAMFRAGVRFAGGPQAWPYETRLEVFLEEARSA